MNPGETARKSPELAPTAKRGAVLEPAGWSRGALVVIVGLLTGSCKPEPEAPPAPLATVGTHTIQVEHLQAQIIRRGGLRPDLVDPTALLQEMINEEALYVAALRAGLDQDPDIQRAHRNLLVGKLKERELNPRLQDLEVTPDEIREHYDQNRERYTRPARVRLAILTLTTPSTLREEQQEALRQRLEEVRDQIHRGTADPPDRGFGTLAIHHSEDQATRYRGGDIGWIDAGQSHGRWSPPVLRAGFALTQIGDVSQVVSDAQGVYLVRLMDRREASRIPLAEVEAEIRQRLLRDHRLRIEREFVNAIRGSLPIEVHTQALARFNLSTSTPRPQQEPRPPSLP